MHNVPYSSFIGVFQQRLIISLINKPEVKLKKHLPSFKKAGHFNELLTPYLERALKNAEKMKKGQKTVLERRNSPDFDAMFYNFLAPIFDIRSQNSCGISKLIEFSSL
ncbi:hypothetical protein [Salibacterium halotolerans]|uniref:hypothetical protein n=1 Tax=Salibacterium halotolerans TaxID=1884432 RepID=UPI0014812AB8|nr:hypothetical protein [Salibacterium halotolerans]